MNNLLELGKIQEELYCQLDDIVTQGVSLRSINDKILNYYSKYNLETITGTDSITINKNNVIYHNTELSDSLNVNDIVTIDTCFMHKGNVIDGAKTYSIGDKFISLIDVSRDVVINAVAMIKEGVKVSQVLTFISDFVSLRGFYLFPEGLGHGLGGKLHEHPYISLSYYDDYSYKFKKGDYFTIEPIIFLYKDNVIEGSKKQGIISMGNVSSQFEVSVYVDNDGFAKPINGGLLK